MKSRDYLLSSQKELGPEDPDDKCEPLKISPVMSALRKISI